MNNFERYSTEFVQSVGNKEGAISPAITSSASFGYGDAQTAEAVFDGSVKKPLYSRMGNPTTAKLETLMAEMDGGVGAIATSSGMGAISLVVLSLLSAGDEVISIGGLFGGSYTLFSETLSRFGVKTHFFDGDALEAIENSVTDKSKIIFLESVGNPNMRLPDIKAIADIAKKHGIALIVDNTVTPMSVEPLKLGADIVVYSTTKIISGNASALGGCAVFRAIDTTNDKFLTPRYLFLEKFIDRAGAMALIVNAKKRALRDLGMSANADASYRTMLGLETLPLRLSRINESIEIVVNSLAAKGFKINHPSLPSHPHHTRYKTDFSQGCGMLFTIDCSTKEKAYSFINRTKLATITANIGDSRTLILHMASTIYRDFSADERAFLGITDGLIRVSIGLENPEDIIEDFLQAMER